VGVGEKDGVEGPQFVPQCLSAKVGGGVDNEVGILGVDEYRASEALVSGIR